MPTYNARNLRNNQGTCPRKFRNMEINYSSPPTAERSCLKIILLLAHYLYLLGSSNTHHLYGRGPKAGLTRPSDRHCNWELFARRLTDRRRMMRRWSVWKGERGHCHPQILNYDPTSRANESSNWMLFGKTLLLLPLPNDVEIESWTIKRLRWWMWWGVSRVGHVSLRSAVSLCNLSFPLYQNARGILSNHLFQQGHHAK